MKCLLLKSNGPLHLTMPAQDPPLRRLGRAFDAILNPPVGVSPEDTRAVRLSRYDRALANISAENLVLRSYFGAEIKRDLRVYGRVQAPTVAGIRRWRQFATTLPRTAL